MQTKDKNTGSVEESDFLLIDKLTQEEWSQIRNLSVQLYHSKQYGDDQLRCGIQGFLLWLSMRDAPMALTDPEQQDFIH